MGSPTSVNWQMSISECRSRAHCTCNTRLVPTLFEALIGSHVSYVSENTLHPRVVQWGVLPANPVPSHPPRLRLLLDQKCRNDSRHQSSHQAPHRLREHPHARPNGVVRIRSTARYEVATCPGVNDHGRTRKHRNGSPGRLMKTCRRYHPIGPGR